MIQQKTNLHFSGHYDKSKDKPSRSLHISADWYVIVICFILHSYAIADAWWPHWPGLAIPDLGVKSETFFCKLRGCWWHKRLWIFQSDLDNTKSDGWRQKQTCSRFVWHACVPRKSLNTIMHNHRTKHVTHHTNSLFTMNISFQTLHGT